MKINNKLLVLVLVFSIILICSLNTLGAEKLVIGFSSPALNEFYIRFEDFAKAGAEILGVDLVVVNADDSIEKQLRDVEDLIASGVDGLIVAPVTDGVARTIFRKIEDAKIPTIVADRNPGIKPQEEFKHYLAYVGPDNVTAGYQIAKFLLENMSAGKNGEKEIVAIEGIMGSSNNDLRTSGFRKALDEYPDVKLVAINNADFHRAPAMALMEDWLIAYDNIDAVWASADCMSLGAVAAIKSAGRMDEIVVGSMDLDPDACESIINGELAYTMGGHWLDGGFALVMMYDYLKGIPIKEEEAFAVLNLLEITSTEMAKEALEKFHYKMVDYDWMSMSRYHNPAAPPAYFDISLEKAR